MENFEEILGIENHRNWLTEKFEKSKMRNEKLKT